MAKEFDGKVKVVVEEYGNSPMATKFGVRRYPVIFVDDVLVARPKDFGFGGDEDVSGGLYVPWLDPANQRKFKDDLRRTVARRLAGEHVGGLNVADVATETDASEGAPTMPSLALRDIAGAPIDASRLQNRPVIVEMWATWCPPCRSTMAWLPSLQKKYGNRATVIAIAVDSKLEDVRKMAASLKPNYPIVMGTPEVIKAFGAVAAVPKLIVYDARGRRSKVLYGAPDDLHDQIEAAVKQADVSR
ncbi:MAG TPA: TlpA disulfide reductase family protein [Vicinamibacterales bacterium]